MYTTADDQYKSVSSCGKKKKKLLKGMKPIEQDTALIGNITQSKISRAEVWALNSDTDSYLQHKERFDLN